MTAKDLIPFTKGDPRINRKGRPKSLKALRKMIQRLGGEPSELDPEYTRIELLVRGMMRSKNSGDHIGVLKYGWGEPSSTSTMLNIDFSQLSDEAVARIAAGEDVLAVLAGKGTSGTGKAEASDATAKTKSA